MSFEKVFINQFLQIILSPRYWEFPPSNWGKKIGLSGANRLTFRGEQVIGAKRPGFCENNNE
jgi:hypothetical protein